MIMAAPGLDRCVPGVESRVIVWSDDDPCLLTAFRYALNDRGFPNVYVAATLEGSIRLVERLAPDVVVTDVYKDRSTDAGADLARAVRANPALAHARIILASGVVCWKDAWSDLFDLFLLKPFRIETAVDAIRGLLGD